METKEFGPHGVMPSHFIQNVRSFKPFEYDYKNGEIWSDNEDIASLQVNPKLKLGWPNSFGQIPPDNCQESDLGETSTVRPKTVNVSLVSNKIWSF